MTESIQFWLKDKKIRKRLGTITHSDVFLVPAQTPPNYMNPVGTHGAQDSRGEFETLTRPRVLIRHPWRAAMRIAKSP